MGYKGSFICQDCKNEFESREGGGMMFLEYRCVACDTIKAVPSNRRLPYDQYVRPTAEQVGTCEQCSGELRSDLQPMCPSCKSRNVKQGGSASDQSIKYD